jgi:hypothetical protein
MNNLPFYINALFVLTTGAAVALSYIATKKTKTVLYILIAWLLLQGLIAVSGFYLNTTSLPPRFLLALMPPVIAIIFLFLTAKGKKLLDQIDLKYLTLIHVVRFPVEITLFLLFVNKLVPEVMTFEGRNYDILAGLSSPVITWLFFIRKKLPERVLLIWNIICLGLVLNITVHGILSAPFPFQQFGFEQPNVGVLMFPFAWLPAFIVPVVIFSHLIAIRRLLIR